MCVLIVFKIFSFSSSCLYEKNLREMLSVTKVMDPSNSVSSQASISCRLQCRAMTSKKY